MTQQEFETRTGLTVTSNEFDYIHRIYMAGTFQKDQFCQEWKKSARRINDNIICDLTIQVELLNANLTDARKCYENAQKGAQQFNSDMADFLIEQAQSTGAFALREKAIKLIGLREFLRRKIEGGYDLWPEDRKELNDILTTEE